MPKHKDTILEISNVLPDSLIKAWDRAKLFPRDYQVKAISSCLQHMGKTNHSKAVFSRKSPVRELLVAPTGSGKTFMAIAIAFLYTSLGLKVLFVVHRDRLIRQTVRASKNMGIPTGVIAGQRKEVRTALFQIASFQTLAVNRDVSWFEPDLVIADEAHYTSFTGVLSELFPDLPNRSSEEPDYLGITATPIRLDPEESMGDKFNSITLAPMPLELIKQGYLCGGSYYSIDNRDKGSKECEISHLYEQWNRLASDRITISFSNRVSRARKIADYFTSKGVKAVCVDGSISKKKREQIYSDLEEGRIQFIASCLALNEGFDCPSVDAIIFDKSTESLGGYIQSLGRGSRIHVGKKNFLVLDATGVVRNLGYLESYRVSEDCLLPKTFVGKKQAPLKPCPECGKYHVIAAKTCSNCGYKFPAKLKIDRVDKPLVKMFWGDEESRRYAFWSRLCIQADKKFGKNFDLSASWVNSIYQDQFGELPPTDWVRYRKTGGCSESIFMEAS